MTTRTLNLDDRLYEYLVAHGVREHPVLAELRDATHGVEGAGMQIGRDQGQLMALLVKLVGARQTIEVGVFTGYSTLAVALALPEEGHILACDINEQTTRIAREHWQRAGVSNKIELVLAPAQQTLDARIAAGESGRYDFAFIDANKTGYDSYYEACLQLLRPGGLIAIDNVLWGGDVAAPSEDADTLALQALNAKVHGDARVDIAMLAVGDGLTLARKR